MRILPEKKGTFCLFIVAGFILAGFLGSSAALAGGVSPSNATYVGIFKYPVTLKNGKWIGKSLAVGGASRPVAILMDGFKLTGDLNGDGAPETAVILSGNSGGSGVYYYLAVLEPRGNRLVNLATTLIGDRVQILGGVIREGKIELKVVRQGPDDPNCCPSQKVLRTWTLKGTKLVAGKTVVLGKLSLSDLGSQVWVLQKLGQEEKNLPAKPEITLRFAGNGKVTGSAGCNRYTGKVTEDKEAAGFVKVASVVSTKMACPKKVMELEDRYLKALKGVMSYSFMGAILALSYKNGQKVDTMFFIPKESR